MKSVGCVFFSVLIVSLFGCANNVVAQAKTSGLVDSYSIGLRPSFNKCIDASGSGDLSMANCSNEELVYQKSRLENAYNHLVSKSSGDKTKLIVESEEKWIAYRDAYCKPDGYGGTRETLNLSSCLMMETAKQASSLELFPRPPEVLSQYDFHLNGVRATYVKCIKQDDESKSAATKCFQVEYQYQDKRLNEAYQKLMAKVPKGKQSDLRESQRIWIAFRDSHCAMPYLNKEKHDAKLNDCFVEETAKQARELENKLFLLELD